MIIQSRCSNNRPNAKPNPIDDLILRFSSSSGFGQQITSNVGNWFHNYGRQRVPGGSRRLKVLKIGIESSKNFGRMWETHFSLSASSFRVKSCRRTSNRVFYCSSEMCDAPIPRVQLANITPKSKSTLILSPPNYQRFIARR